MPPNGRVAAIDIGTNTVLLLIAEGSPDAPRAVFERATITRLGEAVDRTKVLGPEAMERTLACLRSYGEDIAANGVRRTDVVCTSAARDAANGEEFLSRAERALGVRPRIVDGTEEARLAFRGTLSGLRLSGPVTVFDVGGGSTEIIHGHVGETESRIVSSVSLDIGSVRLTERHIRSDPPTPDELARIRADVDRALGGERQVPTMTLVGVAGTVTTLSAIDQGLSAYDPSRVHGALLSAGKIREITTRLSSLSALERRSITGLEPGRADVIVAGAILVVAIVEFFRAESLVVSDRGVRWGLARDALALS
jgi:exopolyphosphatase/guanosine-5'-triphosphate,3'-diphosphate pyrophosphatase